MTCGVFVFAARYCMEPTSFVQGATVAWSTASKDIDSAGVRVALKASTHTLTYYFKSDRYSTSVVGVADGEDWTVTLDATVTDDFPPGYYAWQAFATAPGVKYLFDTGSMEVLADVNATQIPTLDPRTSDRVIRDTLKGLVTNASVFKADPAAAVAMVQELRHSDYIVRGQEEAEKIRRGEVVSNKVLVRFV